jgi:hypothetical protein
MTSNAILQKRPGFIVEEMDGECLLYRQTNHRVVHLNETATVIWKLCDGNRSAADITAVLANEYPGSQAEIVADVTETVALLLDQGVIENVLA